MKKEYKKPIVVFESFSLSTSIAAGCGTTPESSDLYIPGIDKYAFTTSCGYDVTEGAGGDGEFNGFCYHVMTSTSNGGVFNS